MSLRAMAERLLRTSKMRMSGETIVFDECDTAYQEYLIDMVIDQMTPVQLESMINTITYIN